MSKRYEKITPRNSDLRRDANGLLVDDISPILSLRSSLRIDDPFLSPINKKHHSPSSL